MTKRREQIPRLVEQRREIWKLRGRLPRENHKPLCGKCEKPVYKLSINRGYKKIERRPGRPPKSSYSIRPRREHVGWWCESCRLFFYLDGSPDYRGIT